MAELEKVLKGLECCTEDIPTDNNIHKDDFCKNCPYHKPELRYCFAKVDLMRDALELLKPAKAVRMHNTKVSDTGEKVFVANCNNCSGYLCEGWKACPICGKAVTWE